MKVEGHLDLDQVFCLKNLEMILFLREKTVKNKLNKDDNFLLKCFKTL